MQFKGLATVAIALSVSTVHATIDANAVVDDLKSIGQNITHGIKTIENLESGNIATSIPIVVKDITNIVDTIKSGLQMISNKSDTDLPDKEQFDICNAYFDFVDVYDGFADTIIGKDGLIDKLPANALSVPVAGVLQVLNNGFENFLYSFIQLVPKCREEAEQKLEDSSKKFRDAIESFADDISN